MILNTIATLILSYNYNQEIISTDTMIPNNFYQLQKNTIHAYHAYQHHFPTLKKHSTNTIGIVSWYLENKLIQEQ